MRRLLNPLFILHLVFVGLVLIGFLPREWVIFETGLLVLYFFAATLEDSLVFFVRSIPLFIAIPLTVSYDNLNQWRVLAIILFIKWLSSRRVWHYLGAGLILLIKKPTLFIREHSWLVLWLALLGLSFLSLWSAVDFAAGLKRIIYFINASLVGIVITYPPKQNFSARLIKNTVVPIIIVLIVGVIQIVSTYFIDIYQFMRLWGEGIQLREFGSTWSYIAVHVGNTWFAYFGNQLSLRVFSLFPDSHSFPIFLLLGLPAIFAWTLGRPLEKVANFRTMLHTRSTLAVLWIPLVFLMLILSGTRGIWAGGVVMTLWVPIVEVIFRYLNISKDHKSIFKYLAGYFIIFFMLFAVAYPIFASPQFLVSKDNGLLLERRFRSILDFGEMSNSQRLDIWERTVKSIQHNPLTGVGIGNFPVVLGQNIILSKAGSSAHNIYLQVAAEMGVLALGIFLWLLWLVLKTIFDQFQQSHDPILQAYFGGLLIAFPWIMIYLATDVAIFDERALLLCVTTLTIIGTRHAHAS